MKEKKHYKNKDHSHSTHTKVDSLHASIYPEEGYLCQTLDSHVWIHHPRNRYQLHSEERRAILDVNLDY